MDVEHRVTFNTRDPSIISVWARLGFDISGGLNTVLLRESHARWGELKALIDSIECLDIAHAVFDIHEIENAETLTLLPGWHHGYPQPDDDFGYLAASYDLSAYCPHCGSGKRQCAPFRMRSEPRWGRRSILQLNWVFDEYFVMPQLWKAIFEPAGIASREVLSARTLQPLSTVLQLVVPDFVDLDVSSLAGETCPICSRVKYLPFSTDFRPAPKSMNAPMAKSRQDFGSGASSNSLVLCTQQMRRALREAGAKGVEFDPCR